MLARAFAVSRSRRALVLAGAILVGADAATAQRRKKSDRRGTARRSAFPRNCKKFVISAGSNINEEFQHIDDDLEIKIIPRNGGAAKTIFNDNNNSANGPNGDHLSVRPFTARVGDQVHIVARNEVAGGCELDEIWLHCIEGRGGKVKLTDSITKAECASDANKIGVFFDTKVRIKNK
jgi:hypothetical protein